jgi:hypothetical protein
MTPLFSVGLIEFSALVRIVQARLEPVTLLIPGDHQTKLEDGHAAFRFSKSLICRKRFAPT